MNSCLVGSTMADAMKTVFAIVLLSATALAVAKHAPLPPQLIQAKTVYIQNDSGHANLADRCYEELTKWGRFKVVSDPKTADIVFRIHTRSVSTGATATTNATQNGDYTTARTDISEDRTAFTTIDVIDVRTSQMLWSDTRRWGSLYTGFRSATKSVIKELRKRIEEQEPATKP
jgi:hypothetical protein